MHDTAFLCVYQSPFEKISTPFALGDALDNRRELWYAWKNICMRCYYGIAGIRRNVFGNHLYSRTEKPLCPFHRCCGISTMRIANKVYSVGHGRMSWWTHKASENGRSSLSPRWLPYIAGKNTAERVCVPTAPLWTPTPGSAATGAPSWRQKPSAPTVRCIVTSRRCARRSGLSCGFPDRGWCFITLLLRSVMWSKQAKKRDDWRRQHEDQKDYVLKLRPLKIPTF